MLALGIILHPLAFKILKPLDIVTDTVQVRFSNQHDFTKCRPGVLIRFCQLDPALDHFYITSGQSFNTSALLIIQCK